MMSSPSSTANGSSPTCSRATDDRVAEPERVALADVVDVGELGDVLHLLEQVVLALLLEVVLELEVAVEVVLDRALAAAGDDEDVGEPGPHRLLDHVLDRRLVDDRQHLLGLALGGRQEPGPEARGGDHRLLDAALVTGVRRYPSARGPLVADVGRLVGLSAALEPELLAPSPAGGGSTGAGRRRAAPSP